MTDKELIISWFQTIHDNLNKSFPTRYNSDLIGNRDIEIDSVNDEIARCERCIQYITEYIKDDPAKDFYNEILSYAENFGNEVEIYGEDTLVISVKDIIGLFNHFKSKQTNCIHI